MSIIILYPNVAVESVKELAKSLGAAKENPYNTGNRSFKKHKIVFKYGFSRPVHVKKGTLVLNKTKAVALAVDKGKTFELFAEEKFIPAFTKDKAVALGWVKGDGFAVARKTLTGSNGEGMEFCGSKKELDAVKDVKLYTKYIEHTNEFRINVWRDKVISIYNKVIKNDNFKFELFRGAEEHPQLVAMVKKIYEKTNLDFYGLDVVRDKKGNLFLIEINSSPVLFPYTIKKLTTIINGLKEELA